MPPAPLPPPTPRSLSCTCEQPAILLQFCKFTSPQYHRCFEHVQMSPRYWGDFLRQKIAPKIAVNIARVDGPL